MMYKNYIKNSNRHLNVGRTRGGRGGGPGAAGWGEGGGGGVSSRLGGRRFAAEARVDEVAQSGGIGRGLAYRGGGGLGYWQYWSDAMGLVHPKLNHWRRGAMLRGGAAGSKV